MRDHRLSLDHIARAASVIDPVFLDTPQFRMASLDAALGCRLVVKVETLNPIRSFKGRGAEFHAASLTGRPHLVCTTAGNFGQGLAYAARKRDLPLTIFTSTRANPVKVERMRALGGDVRQAGDDFDAAHVAARAFAAERGAQMVEDGRDPTISEGAGTIGVELLRWPEPFDAIVVPLGDGALLGGVSRWVKAHAPGTDMIGVCPRGAPAVERSWRAGRVLDSGPIDTIADGLAVGAPYPEAIADLQGIVDDIVLVDDAELVTAMRLAHRELGIALEPSGAAGLAAIQTDRERFADRRVATILTGGNLTQDQMRQWLG